MCVYVHIKSYTYMLLYIKYINIPFFSLKGAESIKYKVALRIVSTFAETSSCPRRNAIGPFNRGRRSPSPLQRSIYVTAIAR